MKKYKRRRFLLFVGKLGAITLIGSSSKCSNENTTNQNNKANMNDLKEETLELLKEGKEITFKWNCGGDEAIVTTFINGVKMDYRDKYVEQLDIYLVNLLNLPDVGEFDLEGEGKLIEDNGEVFIEYESIMKGFMHYDKNWENPKWTESNKKESMWSGKKELFKKK